MAMVAKLVSNLTFPKFQHDCNKCRFLGRLDGEDIYVCTEGNMGITTFIFRNGDSGHEYSSLPKRVVESTSIMKGERWKFALILEKRNDTTAKAYVTVQKDSEEISY